MKCDPMHEVLDEIRRGRPVVVVDDTDRENEGDLCIAAELATPEAINFMIMHGRGLVCLSLTAERLKALGVPMQVVNNRSQFGTNFTVSIDHASLGDRGVTAAGRAFTIQRALSDDATAAEFLMPGFVFPLRAEERGVLQRRGQTEAVVDLARLAGLKPGGVICEIMAEDGTMVRGAALEAYCKEWGLKLTSVEEICRYRLHHEVSVRRVAECRLDQLVSLPESVLASGPFRATVFVDDYDGQEHLALVLGEPDELQKNPLVRIHSECLTGDVFESRRCDCGPQLEHALRAVADKGCGIILYLQQEGRGIGLGNKLRAYALQEQGLDTVDANIHLGFSVDYRSYRVAARMLKELGVRSIQLLTNNPEKIRSVEEFGITVTRRVPIQIPPDEHNVAYLEAKRHRLGHLLE